MNPLQHISDAAQGGKIWGCTIVLISHHEKTFQNFYNLFSQKTWGVRAPCAPPAGLAL